MTSDRLGGVVRFKHLSHDALRVLIYAIAILVIYILANWKRSLVDTEGEDS